MAKLKTFLACQNGATVIEYAMIASGIAVAIVVAVNGLGSNVKTLYDNVNSSVK